MKLFEIIQSLGLPSKEIRTRFANKQLKINGELCLVLDKEVHILNTECIELGEFLVNLFMCAEDRKICDLVMKARYIVDDVPSMFETNRTDKLTEFLSGFICISISRREHFVFMKQ